MSFLMAVISVWSTICSGLCATIRAARGAVRRSEAWKAWEEFVAGLAQATKPDWEGEEVSFLSGAGCSASEGWDQTLVDSCLQGE